MITFLRNNKIFIAIPVLILLLCNRLIDSAIYRSQIERYELYNNSVRPTNNDEFNYLFETESGNILFNSKIKGSKLVKQKGLKSRYIAVKEIEEIYTRHIQTYSCGTSKAPKTCTRVYWSWDYAGSKQRQSKQIIFANKKYNFKKFDFNRYYEFAKYNGRHYKYVSGGIRYYYKIVKNNIKGTIFVKNKDKKMINVDNSKTISIDSKKVNTLLKECVPNSNEIIVFNIIWYLFSMIIIAILWKKWDEIFDYIK